MIPITLPDGSQREFAGPRHGGRGGRVDRPRPGQGGARPAASDGKAGRHQLPHRARRAAGHRHRQGRRRPGLIRHSTAHLLAYAVKELFPEAQVTIGPVIENGFYYDFAYKRPFTPEDLAAIEAQDGRAGRRRTRRSTRRVLPRDEAVAHFKAHGRALQGRDHRQHPGRRGRVAVPRRRVRGPVPRPARAEHGQAEALQADEGGRRLLARRPPQRDAAAHLRHGLGHARTSCSSTCTCSRRPRSATTASSAASSTCSTSTSTRPGMVFWHPKGWTVWQQVEQYMRARLPRQRLPGGQGPADPRPARCGRRRATGTSTARTCSRRSRRSATTRSSR